MAKIPVDTKLAALIDKGEIEAYISDELDEMGKAVIKVPRPNHKPESKIPK